MKKTLILLLAILLCLSLLACDSQNKGTEIIGSWKKGPWIMIFHEDGTGTDPDGEALSWSYNREKDRYVVVFSAHSSYTFELLIETDADGEEFITIKGADYYRIG